MQPVPTNPSTLVVPSDSQRRHFKQLFRIWHDEGPVALRERLDELETTGAESRPHLSTTHD